MRKTMFKAQLLASLVALACVMAFAPAAFAVDPDKVDETFGIGSAIETSAVVTVSGTTQTYTGKAIAPKVTVKLKEDVTLSDGTVLTAGTTLRDGTHYFMWYEDNLNVSTAKAKGTAYVCAYDEADSYLNFAEFKIVPAKASKFKVKVANAV